MDEAARDRRLMARDLWDAIARDQLTLTVPGAEVGADRRSLRPRHWCAGSIPSGDDGVARGFHSNRRGDGADPAEREWVLGRACRQGRAWLDAGLHARALAVESLGAPVAAPSTWTMRLTAALRQAGLAPEWLEVEPTESLVMHDVNRTIDVLRGLRQMGVTVAVDDFGTGDSSLKLPAAPADRCDQDRSRLHRTYQRQP